MDRNIPQQIKGGFSDTVSNLKLASVDEAIFHFEKVKKRFLDINSWELFAGKEKADFALCDAKGNLVLDKPKLGYFIRIQVPGLHNSTGNSYDWVKIELIEKEFSAHSEMLYIRVRPAQNPTFKNGKIAHFFTDCSTSNFIIKRNGDEIFAEVHGRNEIPNTQDLSILEQLRNGFVAISASLAGSKFQWKSLTDGLIKEDEK